MKLWELLLRGAAREEVGARELLLQGGALELSCERLEPAISEGKCEPITWGWAAASPPPSLLLC